MTYILVIYFIGKSVSSIPGFQSHEACAQAAMEIAMDCYEGTCKPKPFDGKPMPEFVCVRDR